MTRAAKLTMTQVKRAIQQCLSPDLLTKEWRDQVDPDNPVAGHCTVASEAFFHFAGGSLKIIFVIIIKSVLCFFPNVLGIVFN